MADNATQQLNNLQILRALAAVGVVLAHLTHSYRVLYNAGNTVPDFFLGNAGVDLFFVISGFIMVYASERLFGAPSAGWRFIGRRIARIVPLYWLATLYAYWMAGGNFKQLEIIGSFFFLPFPTASGGPILIVGWTLNYEMFFYFVFAFAVFLARGRAVILASAIIIGLIFLGEVTSLRISPIWRHFTNPLMFEFVMGMWIAMLFRCDIYPSPRWATWGLAIIGLCLVWFSKSDGGQNFERVGTWGLGFSLFVAGVVLGRIEPSGGVWKPLIFIGDASYAIYLTHWFVVLSPPTTLRDIGPTSSPTVYSIAIISYAIAIGCIVHLIVERPISRVFRLIGNVKCRRTQPD